MDKRFMTVALLSGALALAGCGGSDSTSNGPNPPPPDPAGDPSDYKRVVVKEGGGFTLHDQNEDDAGSIRSEDVAYFGEEGTGVAVTCPETATKGCAWRIDGGILWVTGGAENGALWTAPVVPKPAGAAARPTSTSDPLSNAVLLEALKANGTAGKVKTPWTTDSEGLADVDGGTPLTYPDPGNTARKTVLTVEASGESIYWGHWHRYTEDAADRTDADKRTDVARGVVYGGAKRYDAKPDDDVRAATYAGNVHLFYKSGKDGKWMDGSQAADLSLNANFKDGVIGGKITGVEAAITHDMEATNDYDITLKDTAIGSDGTFGDMASFKKASDQEGSWKGAFYNNPGSTTRAVNKDNKPGFVAGEFSVTSHDRSSPSAFVSTIAESTGPTEYVHDLTVHGAFGGPPE